MLKTKWHYKNKEDEPLERSPLGEFMSKASVPAALVGSYYAAAIRIRKIFFKNLKEAGMFDDIEAKRLSAYEEIKQAAKEGKVQDIRQEYKTIEHECHADLLKRVENLGYHGLSDQFAALKRHERLDTMLLFAGVSSITIGALLTIANQYDKLRAHDLKKAALQEEQSRG